MEFKDYISIIALVLSVTSLFISIYEKRIKLSARLDSDDNGYYIEIYNNSSRRVTLSLFKIYSSKYKYSSNKTFAETWYDYNQGGKRVIQPYESASIEFDEDISLGPFMNKLNGNHVYITLFVSGKKAKTIKLV